MEDYEMTDRVSNGSKYRYKRNYNNIGNSDSCYYNPKPEKRMKFSTGNSTNEPRINFPVYIMNYQNTSNDIEMNPVLKAESIKKYLPNNNFRSHSDKVKQQLAKYHSEMKQGDSKTLFNYYDCCSK
jgi:hypothetical protein